MDTKVSGKDLEAMLTYKLDHIAKKDRSIIDKSYEFCEGYMDFLGQAKTERLANETIIDIAKANGYVEFDPNEYYPAGSKVYVNNRGKSVILSTLCTIQILPPKLSSLDASLIMSSRVQEIS